MSSHALIACNRFGLGAAPGEITVAARDPKGWLLDQLAAPQPMREAGLRSSTFHVRDYLGTIAERREAREKMGVQAGNRAVAVGQQMYQEYKKELEARTVHAMTTRSSFHERWVRFWANHFTASADKFLLLNLAGAFEREVIREHALGRFADMLKASSLHPAMLTYLDNDDSIGPNSDHGSRTERSYNENLAREILELHTLGVDGGYTIEDIKGLAMILTGWTVGRRRDEPKVFGQSYFEASWHEPGAHRMLGKAYAEGGEGQIGDALDDLARHPSTARFVARKLAEHFIGSKAPPGVAEALERTFRETDGNLKALAQTLVQLESSWADTEPPLKTPEEYVISLGRLFPGEVDRFTLMMFRALGQEPMQAPGPDGWPASGEGWITPENILTRAEYVDRFARRFLRQMGLNDLLAQAFGGQVSRTTMAAINGKTETDALTLLLVSSDFMRRGPAEMGHG